MSRTSVFVFSLVVFFSTETLSYAEGHLDDPSAGPKPTLNIGAKVFNKRCVLCHGKKGMGEGFIPMTVKSYPNTNLMKGNTGTDLAAIKEAVVWGGMVDGGNPGYSPPWGKELTWTEIESVALLIKYMREDHKKAQTLLVSVNTADAESSVLEPISSESGRVIYKSRCVICHGEKGKGDGKMVKIIKDPPPHNLTLSALPDELLMQIIMEGGEAVGRSMHMPPWKDELTKEELESVIAFIKTLRAY